MTTLDALMLLVGGLAVFYVGVRLLVPHRRKPGSVIELRPEWIERNRHGSEQRQRRRDERPSGDTTGRVAEFRPRKSPGSDPGPRAA